ncbi:MAG: OsmC family peroxiredoxin [Myxococcales bacterium]|nr:OsmC family peroxiredoxin [Myxococcales bacterium]
MQSRANAVWEGDLMSGKGNISAQSGTFKSANLSWKARTEGAASHTTPEELLAAAHAACFSMALSNGLAKGGHPAKKLETTCTVEFGPKQGGGFEVKSSALEVKGSVPGIDQAAFQKAAEDAKNGCPISGALKIPMSVQASLA